MSKTNKPTAQVTKEALPQLKTNHSLNWLPYVVIALIGFILYIQSIKFDYAIDDKMVITDNAFTKKGFAGLPQIFGKESLVGFFGTQKDLLVGSRYRPLSIATFAIEYQFLGNAPGFSHFINILLYCFTGILLFYLLKQLLPLPVNKPDTPWYLCTAFLATALFMAHPIHTEVIANIKGRDEILTLLGSLGSLYFILQYLKNKKIIALVFSSICFFLGLLAKENAITFLAIIPLTLYYFTNTTNKKIAFTLIPLLAVTFIYFLIRKAALGYFISSGTQVTELLNNPFLGMSFSQKYATIIFTLGYYIRLLLFPHPLTADYYPYHPFNEGSYPSQIPAPHFSDWQTILSIIVHTLLLGYALMGIHKKQIISYGILFYLITLSIVSNIVFPVGAFMNERFVYISSIGYCLIVAYLISNTLIKATHNQKIASYALLLLMLGYSFKTLARVPDWKNNHDLFLADVQTSKNSTKANTSAGGTLLESAVNANSTQQNELINKAISYLNQALKIYPNNTNALLLIGNAYMQKKEFTTSINYYSKLFDLNSNTENVQINLSIMSEFIDKPEDAQKLVDFIEQRVINNTEVSVKYGLMHDALGVLYGKKLNNLDKAIENFKLSVEKSEDKNSPDYFGTIQDLAIAYGMKGDFLKALELNTKVLEKQPNNAKLLLNIAITYQNMHNTEKANEYYQKAFTLDPSLQGAAGIK